MAVNINIPKPIIDYNDLENKPTLVTQHSQLTLNDGTNPHGTTKADVGLNNVPNLDTTNAINKAHDPVTLDGAPNYLTIIGQAITRGLINLASHVTGRLPFSNLATGTARSVVGRSGSGNGDVGNISAGNDTILSRSGSGDVNFNSANTVKTILSLQNVDNTSDLSKPISTATQTALDLKADDASISLVGKSNNYDDLTNKPTIPSVAGANGEIQFNSGGVFGASSKLKFVNGTLEIEGSGSTAATATQIWRNASNVELMRVSDNGELYNSVQGSNANHRFLGPFETRFRLLSGGNTDSNSALTFFVNGGVRGSCYGELSLNGIYDSSATFGGAIYLDTRGFAPLRFATKNTGQNPIVAMVIDVGQRVGIGTESPTSKLQVKGSGSTSATATQIWQNASNVELMRVRDNGDVNMIGILSTLNASLNGFKLDSNSGSPKIEFWQGIARFSLTREGNDGLNFGSNNGYVAHFSAPGVLIGGTSRFDLVVSAQLQVNSTTKGFLPPRMTTTQKNAITSPATGLVVYDTTTNKLCCFNGSTWNDLF